MDIRGRRRSSNIEDRRGMRPVRTGVGLSLGGVLFLVVLSLLGINPLPFLGVATKAPEVQMQDTGQPYQETQEERRPLRVEARREGVQPLVGEHPLDGTRAHPRAVRNVGVPLRQPQT